MNTVTPQMEQITQHIDRLIAEMLTLRQQVIALNQPSLSSTQNSVQQAEYFGVWSGREELQNRSSREWLEDLRYQQWTH